MFGVFGGVGLVVVEIGKVMGVWVIVVVSIFDKFVVVKVVGVDELINYSEGSLCE